MKKIIALILVLILCVSVVVSCAGNGGETETSATTAEANGTTVTTKKVTSETTFVVTFRPLPQDTTTPEVTTEEYIPEPLTNNDDVAADDFPILTAGTN